MTCLRFAPAILLMMIVRAACAQGPFPGPAQSEPALNPAGADSAIADEPPPPSVPFSLPPGPSGPSAVPEAPAAITPERIIVSHWDVRVDYFHWNERLDGMDFVNEDGPLVTLAYARRSGRGRLRVELFGGDVHYDGGAQFDDGSTDPLSSHTGYLGTRAELELLAEPDWAPGLTFFAGGGTRLWVRDLRGGTSDSGYAVYGYQETWWTTYPYVGLETRRVPSGRFEWFGAARIGCTPLTYEWVPEFDVTLHPRTGITGQLEGGLRSERFHLSVFSEAMTWSESGIARDMLQPASKMITVGLRAGLGF